MKRDHGSLLGFYTIGIAMLFLAGFFMLIIFGTQNYHNAVAGQNNDMQSRAILSYLSTTVKGYDVQGTVNIEDSEYGQELVISDGDSGYELRIFCYEGKLMEEYVLQNTRYLLEDAQTIGETDTFDLSLNGNILTIDTDEGRVLLCLRSEGGDVR